jgi:hypothetical protein
MADPLVRARPKRKKVLADYLVRLRWIPALFVALPISALIYLSVFLVNTWSAMKSEKRRQKEHQENVEGREASQGEGSEEGRVSIPRLGEHKGEC